MGSMEVKRYRRSKLILEERERTERESDSTMLAKESKDRLAFSTNVVGDGDNSH